MTRPPQSPSAGLSGSSFDAMRLERDVPSTAERAGARAAVLSAMFPEGSGEWIDDRYELRGLIGSGGLGRVHRARDHKLHRDVALKVLRGSRLSAALEREARVLAQLQHPNVVTVYDVGTWNERLFLTMELIDGQSLAQWLRDEPRRLSQIVSVFRDAGRGIAAAHAKGVVHRDFKPANVMLSADGRVRVVDFGLAREAEVTASEDDPDEGGRRTQAAGTRPYMAPEQFDGKVAPQSDQFAFCTSLFEALCNQRPWTEASRGIADASDAARLTSSLRAASVPRWLRRTIVRGLHRDRTQRFSDFGSLMDGLSPPARRGAWALGLGLGAAAIATAMPPTARPCDDRGAAASQVWGTQARQTIAATAAKAKRAVEAGQAADSLDAYVEAWNRLDAETCELRHSGTDQAARAVLRERCLEASLDKVQFFVDVLVSGPVDFSRIATVAKEATNLAPCHDDEALLLAQPEPDRDPEIGAQINAGIDRAHVRMSLGDQTLHDAELERLIDQARLDAAPRDAVWLKAHWAHALLNRGDAEQAEQVARGALAESVGHANWTRETGVLMGVLAQVLIQTPGNVNEATTLARLSLAALSKAPGTRHLQLVPEMVLAQAALEAGDLGAAHQANVRAREIAADGAQRADRDWFDRPINTAQTLATRGQLALARGDAQSAVTDYEAALAAYDSGTGATVLTAALLNNLAVARRARGDQDGYLEALQRAIEIRHELKRESDEGGSLTNLGNAYRAAGRMPEAMAAYDAALEVLMSPSRRRAYALYARGLAYQASGDLSRARDDLELAAADARREVAFDDALHFPLHIARGQVFVELADHARARRALTHAEAVQPTDASAYDLAELHTATAKAWSDADAGFAAEHARLAIGYADAAKDAALIEAAADLRIPATRAPAPSRGRK